MENGAIGLLINIFFPGLGTLLIGGKEMKQEGIIQIVVGIIGVILAIFIIGIPLMIIAWVWALLSGIKMAVE